MVFKSITHKIALAALATTLLGTALQARADGLDPASQEALEKTQSLLTNEQSRETAINASPDAQRANASVQQLSGSKENMNAVYGLSSDIFSKMAKDSQGNSDVMQQQLDLAQKNPAAFLDSLTPEQKRNLEILAHKIETEQASKAP